MSSKKSDRRKFLKTSAALAGLAVGGVPVAIGQAPSASGVRDLHAYGERSRFETSIRTGNNGYFGNMRDDLPKPGVRRDIGLRAPLQDSMGIITPASVHYVISHGYEPPAINPMEHRLLVHGMVDHPLTFTMEDLKRLPSVSRVHFIECRANGDPARLERKMPNATAQTTHGFSSCSVWTGVALSTLLKDVGVKSGATWVIAQSTKPDSHTKSIPMAKAMDDVLIAYGQNGEAVRPEHGYPLRLVVPGYEGINNVKWLGMLRAANEPYMDKRETTDYPELRPDGKARWFNSEMGPNSVITFPSGGQQLTGRGYYQIGGLAWSGGGAIRRVEVSIDGGRSWKDAEVQAPVHSKAFTRFGFGWNWNGQETLLQSRSSDERGDRQPTVAEMAKMWNLPVSYYESAPFLIGHFCVIQTWKVLPDGSVQNALFT